MTTLTAGGWTNDFERINRHRALAELVIHNHNWLPWWLTTSVVGDFCEQAERFMRGEGLPPFPVRLWWAYRHWKFRKVHQRARVEKLPSPIDTMQQSKITGDRFMPNAMIPLAEGQHVRFIPVVHRNGTEIEVTDIKSGKRRKVFIDDAMLNNLVNFGGFAELPDAKRTVWSGDDGEFEIDCTQVQDLKRRWISAQKRPTDIGSLPRPNCPKCHTPNPTLGTPLDPKSPSGWGDSFFTCSNHKCGYPWKLKKVYPLLEENKNKEGTVTGTLIKGTDIPFHMFGKVGVTVDQMNEAIRKIANVAGISSMTPEQQLRMQEVIQNPAGQETPKELARVTKADSDYWAYRQDIWENNR